MTHTSVPSVTGDGDDMFCFRTCRFPSATCRFQMTWPFARSTHHSHTRGPSATLRKTRLPQTIGVEPDQAGSARLHARPSVFDQRVGRLVPAAVPFSCGPRHCGQLSASRWEMAQTTTTIVASTHFTGYLPSSRLRSHLPSHFIILHAARSRPVGSRNFPATSRPDRCAEAPCTTLCAQG